MKRGIPVLIILIIAIIAAGCTGTQQPVEQQTSKTPAPSAATTVPPTMIPVPTPLSQASVSDNTVTIKDFAFVPQTITVKTGAIVRWENLDSAPHRIIFTDFNGRDTTAESGVLSSHQSYSRKFDAAGEFRYYCKIHPSMKGSVVVE